MNPARSVLRNDYVVRMICRFLMEDPFKPPNNLKKLLAFALVCPVSGTYAALSVLWREPSFDNIYCLFPAAVVSANTEGRKSFTRTPVTLEQWSRFDIYSRWIRVLTPFFSWDVEIALCAALARHPRQRYPFPNLTCLNLHMDAFLISHATVLLCPTLTAVEIRLSGAVHDDRVSDVICAMQETCQRLERFTYFPKIFTRTRAAALDDALTSLVRHSNYLRTAFVPAFRKMVDALGRLPYLSELSLYDGSNSVGLPIAGGIILPEQDTNHGKFISLDSLTIFAPPSLQSLTECLRNSRCFARKKFNMEIMTFNEDIDGDEWSTLGRRLSDFFRMVLETNTCSGLQTIQISTEKPFDRFPDSWQRFRHLLSLRNLEHVAVGEFFLDINDSDLEAVTHAWPNLRSLELTIPPTLGYQSQITFQGLAYLSTLPNLRHLSLTLGSGSIIPPMLPASIVPWESPISPCPVTTMEMRGELPHDINSTQIMLFLMKLFPELTTIIAPDWRSQARWADVQAALDVTRNASIRLRALGE